ncbi:MAG: L-threonylcarbamoyladenylate synthase [Patescibacteria group bacterium]
MQKTIQNAVEILKKGGLVVFPTDTVYGLLVDAKNAEAVAKLVEFKERPAGKAISIFVSDLSMLEEYVEIDDKARNTLEQILPGPYTVVLRSKHKVRKELEAENGTLGVRIPASQLINQLIREFGGPITATSANLAGRSPHYSVESFLKELSVKKRALIDLIVDEGTLPRNKPSTVIDLTQSNIKILRHGDDRQLPIVNYQLSNSEKQTKEIAKEIIVNLIKENEDKPLICIIKGDLGAGKTVFVKGVGELLGIRNIISPTFVIYYEYASLFRNMKTLVHVDLYNIQEAEEFKHLGLEKYLQPGTIMCIEWGEKAGEIIEELKDKGRIIYITLEHVNETKRKIQFSI